MQVIPPVFPWKKATFLHERATAKNADPVPGNEPGLEEAERRASAWRQLMSGDDATLDERLKSIGLDRDAFLQILVRAGSQEEGIEDSGSWVSLIEEVIEQRHAGEPLPASLQPPASPGQPGLAFSGFLLPFIRIAAARLRTVTAALQARYGLENPLLSPEAEASLLEGLARRLQFLSNRTLILELNVARVMDELPGDTPQERFHHFCTVRLQEPRVLMAVLEEYPVLARLLATSTERWLTVSLELLERLAREREQLGQAFLGGQDIGSLAGLQSGVSDLHREGRSVVLLKFSSGLKLVYKPKSLAVDVRFQELLQSLNGWGAHHPHRVLTVLDRGTHGWVEYVEASGCDSREALQRFYWRQGSSLALLHLLAAVDFHLENLIAAGEYPVLVDLEALFHQRLVMDAGESAMQRAWAELDRSIISVGMLPMLIFGRAGRAGVDMSGLGGEAGQLSPHAVPMVEDANRDTMRMVRRQGRTSGSSNRPQLQGQPVDASDFTEDIVQGFEETYRLLREHREVLGSHLQAFADVEVRHIVRATQRYALLLQESVHPDFLREGLERDKVLDNLWAEASLVPALRRLVPFEHADLRLGDVPLFATRPGQRHLWSSTGECIRDYFPRDSLSEVQERLARLSEKDCAWQVSLIRKSMVSIDKSRGTARPAPRTRPSPSVPPASREDCLAAAVTIGEDLAAKAIRGSKDVSWIGMSLEDLGQWRWSLSPMGADLYEGVGGLTLFFAYLARETGRTDFEALARAGLETVRDAWRNPDPSDAGVGAYVGRASSAYVLAHLASLWNQPELLDDVLAGIPALEPLIDADTRLDLLSGSAGCALVLLGLHARTGDSRLLDAARRCGERLLVTAQPCPEGGVGWKGPAGQQPLSGFSHGAAGIAYALLELASATGDTRFRELAHQALTYERALFVPERGNWRDLREQDGAPEEVAGFMLTWCHGAPGIALGRLCSLRHLDGVEVRAELETALTTTLREGFGGSHCLCHGDLGNVEPLYLAGELLGEPRWIRAALNRAGRILHQGRERGWLCGLPRGTETPGLMMGLAGIGYGLLRLAAPERVPSVLTLAMPS
ncbi:type 2 lanthipeptide synthetase LanM family protein [Archangium lansingense]|uniref:Type 2 lanthipeptide synthetase LanM family protein n=1 Tax=Archangium lansingense TaxID=2995310 RepID=A0ABT4A6G5_9BACT|nr:type 2 lanthipeptide synthetase LanM family protein [Archangium lansinium]MCY1077217.1 type 2 lanthipeptide synthetase LanM family protein [Archangium lansinium]